MEMAELLRKPGVKSLVWDYFGVKKVPAEESSMMEQQPVENAGEVL